ncbi:beta-carotene 15,15'-monooxygenase, Brp/Blh family [Algoriphagus ornithinivorans]|uniref:Probable beta-carotene 15,15'-dioxygenase n=1 Tax=Algoriphagus ornithinivorans TaxID=226506 RepID=A0A1I5BWT2_9BACT|nr:Brp/Blh family beta-carotene 15,15'-dioxygenase [Algoriphagus ornithinivorans]SFN79134.1 beta-carotene 15,15'-monooxygenase, Brp/Blh family [Algoriphagus ornithinivorans]
MRSIEGIFKILGLGIGCVYALFSFDLPILDYGIFLLILLTAGIPHGAIDHLTSNPHTNQKSLIRFLINYLSLIAAYLLIWYIVPKIALSAFLLMSAYHFGQTHFIKREFVNNRLLNFLLYCSRGLLMLSVILFGDFEMTQSILAPILDVEGFYDYQILIISVFLISSLSTQLYLKIGFSKADLIDLTVLPILLYFSPLLVSFIIYFGFWHAVPSMMVEYRFLEKFPKFRGFKKFLIQLLPFSILSFIGIGLILFLGLRFLESQELLLLFFVLISLISFPHILYMDNFFKKISNTDQY